MKTTEYPPHPLSELFDIEPTESLAKLAESIKANGQREDIVLHEGQVLDGNNRQKACGIAKVAPRYRNFGDDPADGPSPAHFVKDKNLLRRHLTAGQRASLAEEFFPIFQAEANLPADEARKIVAAQFSTTPKSVRVAAEIAKTDPATAKEVKAGKTTLNAGKAKADAKQAEEASEINADAEYLKKVRTVNAKAIEKIHGEAFGSAFEKGIVLKTKKEIDAFLALEKDDQKIITELLVKGWAVAQSLKFVHRILDERSTIGDLILQAASFEKGKAKLPKVVVNGWVITARKVVEGAD